jgi:hypothetical protein
VLDSARGVPEAHGPLVELLDQREVVVPGQLCKRCLHDFANGPRRSERVHVLQVSGGQPAHVGESLPQIVGEPVDHLRSPPLLFLSGMNNVADMPVEPGHRRVRGDDGSEPRLLDALLQLAEPKQQRRISCERDIG